MICSYCNGLVLWKGPITALTHTECQQCGAKNSQLSEDHISDEPDDECPHCGGEGYVWGCFEDCCVCTDDDGLGCDPIRCDYCRPVNRKGRKA